MPEPRYMMYDSYIRNFRWVNWAYFFCLPQQGSATSRLVATQLQFLSRFLSTPTPSFRSSKHPPRSQPRVLESSKRRVLASDLCPALNSESVIDPITNWLDRVVTMDIPGPSRPVSPGPEPRMHTMRREWIAQGPAFFDRLFKEDIPYLMAKTPDREQTHQWNLLGHHLFSAQGEIEKVMRRRIEMLNDLIKNEPDADVIADLKEKKFSMARDLTHVIETLDVQHNMNYPPCRDQARIDKGRVEISRAAHEMIDNIFNTDFMKGKYSAELSWHAASSDGDAHESDRDDDAALNTSRGVADSSSAQNEHSNGNGLHSNTSNANAPLNTSRGAADSNSAQNEHSNGNGLHSNASNANAPLNTSRGAADSSSAQNEHSNGNGLHSNASNANAPLNTSRGAADSSSAQNEHSNGNGLHSNASNANAPHNTSRGAADSSSAQNEHSNDNGLHSNDDGRGLLAVLTCKVPEGPAGHAGYVAQKELERRGQQKFDRYLSAECDRAKKPVEVAAQVPSLKDALRKKVSDDDQRVIRKVPVPTNYAYEESFENGHVITRMLYMTAPNGTVGLGVPKPANPARPHASSQTGSTSTQQTQAAGANPDQPHASSQTGSTSTQQNQAAGANPARPNASSQTGSTSTQQNQAAGANSAWNPESATSSSLVEKKDKLPEYLSFGVKVKFTQMDSRPTPFHVGVPTVEEKKQKLGSVPARSDNGIPKVGATLHHLPPELLDMVMQDVAASDIYILWLVYQRGLKNPLYSNMHYYIEGRLAVSGLPNDAGLHGWAASETEDIKSGAKELVIRLPSLTDPEMKWYGSRTKAQDWTIAQLDLFKRAGYGENKALRSISLYRAQHLTDEWFLHDFLEHPVAANCEQIELHDNEFFNLLDFLYRNAEILEDRLSVKPLKLIIHGLEPEKLLPYPSWPNIKQVFVGLMWQHGPLLHDLGLVSATTMQDLIFNHAQQMFHSEVVEDPYCTKYDLTDYLCRSIGLDLDMMPGFAKKRDLQEGTEDCVDCDPTDEKFLLLLVKKVYRGLKFPNHKMLMKCQECNRYNPTTAFSDAVRKSFGPSQSTNDVRQICALCAVVEELYNRNKNKYSPKKYQDLCRWSKESASRNSKNKNTSGKVAQIVAQIGDWDTIQNSSGQITNKSTGGKVVQTQPAIQNGSSQIINKNPVGKVAQIVAQIGDWDTIQNSSSQITNKSTGGKVVQTQPAIQNGSSSGPAPVVRPPGGSQQPKGTQRPSLDLLSPKMTDAQNIAQLIKVVPENWRHFCASSFHTSERCDCRLDKLCDAFNDVRGTGCPDANCKDAHIKRTCPSEADGWKCPNQDPGHRAHLLHQNEVGSLKFRERRALRSLAKLHAKGAYPAGN